MMIDKQKLFSIGRGLKLKPAEIAVVLFMGLVVGLFVGYLIMGTAHAMFDIGELNTYYSVCYVMFQQCSAGLEHALYQASCAVLHRLLCRCRGTFQARRLSSSWAAQVLAFIHPAACTGFLHQLLFSFAAASFITVTPLVAKLVTCYIVPCLWNKQTAKEHGYKALSAPASQSRGGPSVCPTAVCSTHPDLSSAAASSSSRQLCCTVV